MQLNGSRLKHVFVWVAVNMVINSFDIQRTMHHDIYIYIHTHIYMKANKMHHFSSLFWRELHIFQTGLLSIIRSLNTVFTAIGICHTVMLTVC